MSEPVMGEDEFSRLVGLRAEGWTVTDADFREAKRYCPECGYEHRRDSGTCKRREESRE